MSTPVPAPVGAPLSPAEPVRSRALLAAAVGPVLLLAGVRWWLQARLERSGMSLPPELVPASDPEQFLLSLAWGVAACLAFAALVWWLVRKPGPLLRLRQTGRWVLAGCWVLAWLWGSVHAVRSQDNRWGLEASRTETLALVGLRPQAPSLHSPGGVMLYLDWPEQGGLHTVLVDRPTPAWARQPDRVTLQLAHGRQSGWYVLGWSLPEVSGVGTVAAAGSTPESAPAAAAAGTAEPKARP